MASVNKVMVMGRLGQDPELRYTQNQTAVCSLNVATTEFRMAQDGQRQEMTEWHRVVVWGKQVENASKYLAKGRGVFIEGRLQTRSWEDQNGQKRYTTEIVANNVQFLPQGQPQDSQIRLMVHKAAPPTDKLAQIILPVDLRQQTMVAAFRQLGLQALMPSTIYHFKIWMFKPACTTKYISKISSVPTRV